MLNTPQEALRELLFLDLDLDLDLEVNVMDYVQIIRSLENVILPTIILTGSVHDLRRAVCVL